MLVKMSHTVFLNATKSFNRIELNPSPDGFFCANLWLLCAPYGIGDYRLSYGSPKTPVF